MHTNVDKIVKRKSTILIQEKMCVILIILIEGAKNTKKTDDLCTGLSTKCG